MYYNHDGKNSISETNTAAYKIEVHLFRNLGLPTGTIIELLVDHSTILSGQLLLMMGCLARSMNPLAMNTSLFFSCEVSPVKETVLYRTLLWQIRHFVSLWMMLLTEYYGKGKLVYIKDTNLFLWEQNPAPFIIGVVIQPVCHQVSWLIPLGSGAILRAQLWSLLLPGVTCLASIFAIVVTLYTGRLNKLVMAGERMANIHKHVIMCTWLLRASCKVEALINIHIIIQ